MNYTLVSAFAFPVVFALVLIVALVTERERVLRHVAHRCETHHRATVRRTRELEDALGLSGSDLVMTTYLDDEFDDPALTACGHIWCTATREMRDSLDQQIAAARRGEIMTRSTVR